MNICIIITAAGMSTRQEQNKLLIRKCNETTIEKTVNTFIGTGLKIYTVIGYESDQVRPILEDRFRNDIKIVENDEYKIGIASSIKVGLSAAGNRYDYYGFCNGDKPFIQNKSIVRILEYLDSIKPKILIPIFQERSGHPTFFSKKYLPQLFDLDGDVGGKIIAENNLDSVTYLPINDEGIVLDMDSYLSK